MSTFSLIDPTNKYHTSPVVVNMFCHKKECFPDIVKIGDVVRFHRAKKNKVQDKTVLTTYGDGGEHSNIVFHRRVDHLSGFPVVHAPLDHDGAADATPLSAKSDRYGRINIMMSDGVIIFPYLHVQEWSYQTNSQHVTFTPQDADRVKNLYNWGIQSLHRYSLHDIHIPLNSLRDVLESNSEVQVTKFDLVCLVLSNPSRHLDGSYTLKVWDASLSNIIVGGVGPGMQILVGDLEKELKNVFAHCMGWPVEFVAQLQSGSFCPGSCEGDLTAGGDVAALAEWYRPRLDQFSADQTLLQQLTEDILNRYAVIHIVDAPSQDRYIRKHARPGSWVRIRDVEVESETRVADSSISSPVVEKKLKMTCRTHVNKILPYFRYNIMH